MNKEKLKIVVIGCGRFSQFFVPLFKAHPVVEKVYVCDLKKEREQEFSERFGVDRCESFEYALASKEINAVAIFTQRFKHGKMVPREVSQQNQNSLRHRNLHLKVQGQLRPSQQRGRVLL